VSNFLKLPLRVGHIKKIMERWVACCAGTTEAYHAREFLDIGSTGPCWHIRTKYWRITATNALPDEQQAQGPSAVHRWKMSASVKEPYAWWSLPGRKMWLFRAIQANRIFGRYSTTRVFGLTGIRILISWHETLLELQVYIFGYKRCSLEIQHLN
jgi:hypothetical protein